jgi:hypothetical protein
LSEKRGPWYLLTGLLLGLALGIFIAWVVLPIPYVNATPASLRNDFKDQYRYQIASVYAATGNLERARARLAEIKTEDPVKALGEQAQRRLANNASMETVRPLANLAEALQANPVALVLPTETATPASDAPAPALPINEASATPGTASTALAQTDTPYPTATPDLLTVPTLAETITPPPTPIPATPPPTRTLTPTPGTPFELSGQSTFCEPTQPGLLQIYLQNSSGQPAAGVELVITWAGGAEHFFTGLKPELGNGYADFSMTPNVEYALNASGNTRVTGLISSTCTAQNGDTYLGGIRLEFKQPKK